MPEGRQCGPYNFNIYVQYNIYNTHIIHIELIHNIPHGIDLIWVVGRLIFTCNMNGQPRIFCPQFDIKPHEKELLRDGRQQRVRRRAEKRIIGC